MAIQNILSSDKLQSGFRAKYNTSVNEIWVNAEDLGTGVIRFTKHDGAFLDVPLTTSFYTQDQIDLLIVALSPASYTNAGSIEIATDAEVLAGISETLAITPYGLQVGLSGESNPTTSELTITQLEAAYPDVRINYPVICKDITDNPLLYLKTGEGIWHSIPLGGVAP